MASLVETFRKIGSEYSVALGEPYTDHPLASFIRSTAPEILKDSLPELGQGFLCEGSAGRGNFATVPWLALFDPLVTTNAQSGYYAVYLYATNGELFLSLNQGVTAVRREFGSRTRDVLEERAGLIRARLADYSALMPIQKLDLGAGQMLPRNYESGHALGFRYEAGLAVSEDSFRNDLHVTLAAYRALTFRGGLDPSPETKNTAETEGDIPLGLEEVRQYRMHRRIERNRQASVVAKLLHGYTCQVCNFNFSEAFGDLGEGFIEAHHLRPLASLNENEPVRLDVEADFAVLCSNCHRMIHRMDDPSDLNSLRQLRIKRLS